MKFKIHKRSGRWICDLPDAYGEICDGLRAGRPLAFSRFGDGELNAVFGEEGRNIDGHRYHPELGRRLYEIIESKPDYLMGLMPFAFLIRGDQITSISEGIEWVQAGALHEALVDGRLGRFFEALEGRPVVLVGPPHLRELAIERGWLFAEVAYGDCWPQYESLKTLLTPWTACDGVVMLFCMSMTSNVLIDDLYRLNPRNTYVDVGSIFDPYAGVISREYHRELHSVSAAADEVNPATGIKR